jgi:hypothetical protein
MQLRFRKVVLRCVIGLSLGTLVHAQTTGGVRGTVKDATGGVVPHRPGIENTDLALIKVTSLAHGTALELRFEAFNVFNHAQFYGANAVNGNINSPTFGAIVNAAPPRICQVAMKVRF